MPAPAPGPRPPPDAPVATPPPAPPRRAVRNAGGQAPRSRACRRSRMQLRCAGRALRAGCRRRRSAPIAAAPVR
ncbi:hypothetical protein BG36_07445 [Aquamicrobium defluvii]|uniref:Uncharacterized protein n=1 Tax=Aquamicrobium defluvii TaxID=69279 RepID=A0A011UH29_9HYPH|nr:hypothetical protein BG36_07445 [Aquamicrobium defluvii]